MPKVRRSHEEIERDKLESQINVAGQKALLKALADPNPTTLRIWAERNGEKLKIALEENEALKAAASLVPESTVPRIDYDAAIAGRSAAEAELQRMKDGFDAALADERRTLRHGLASIEQREHSLNIKIEAATKKFEATGIKAVIEILQKVVQTGDRTVPDFFKCPCKHVLLWKTFWEDTKAETWCRLAQDNSFTTDTAIEILHVPECQWDGWEPGREKLLSESTAESREYAREFLKQTGWTDQEVSDAVGLLVRQHAERDSKRPIRNAYELEEMSRWQNPTPVQRVQPRDMIDENVQRPPAFVPDRYPYCEAE
jgi:hypothetical protein